MQPHQKKRDIADWFKPYARTTPTIPQKRRSISAGEDEDNDAHPKPTPKTPAKIVTFKDVTPSSVRSAFFTPTSRNSLPIRSPRPNHVASPSPARQTNLLHKVERSTPQRSTTVVPLSFASVSEHNRNVAKGGKVVVVRDSEDDTDSLESLDDIFGKRKPDATTSDSSPPDDTEAERLKLLRSFTSGRSVPIVGKDKLRALYAKEQAVKFDLSGVLDDHFGDEAAQQNIKRMRADFDGQADADDEGHLDRRLLASVVQKGDADDDDVERLLNAVDRTEALSSDKRFAFLVSDGRSKERSTRKDPFPKSAIPHQMWDPKNIHAQDRTFLSGYMAELASASDLSDEALRWTYNQVVKETRSELRQAYVDCLSISTKNWTRLNVTPSDVQSTFQTLGADSDCLRDASSIKSKYHPVHDESEPDYTHLTSALHMFKLICADMDFSALSKLSSILLRLILDAVVMSDCQVSVAAENLLEMLLILPDAESQSHVAGRLFSDATQHLHDPQLQAQLLRHLLPTTTEALKLRKSLADAFLLSGPSLQSDPSRADASLDALEDYVTKSSSFSLTRHVNAPAIDYSALTALTQILDVAVSAGNPPLPGESTSSIQARRNARKLTFVDEANFNKSVDSLADKLHNIFISIKDTGASHMRRTEAKDALQALYFRLLFSVRTKPRKKRHVFDASGSMKGGATKGRWVSGEEWREKEKGGEFMKKFFAKREVAND